MMARSWLAGLGLVAIGVTGCLAGCGPQTSGASSAAPAAGPSGTSRPAPPHPVLDMAQLIRPPAGKYFGVEPSGAADSIAPVQAFASNAGRKPDLIGDYVAWGSPFDETAAVNAWRYGALYYMAWEPFDTTVADIAAGKSNGFILKFARQVKAAGVPVAISFGHEMNGNWYPWGTATATPASFVAAWRLIHAIFATAGATNVIWVWNPNVISAASVPLEPYYPGDSYVNWIGLTGYFPTTGAETFAEAFGPTMAEIRQFTHLPFIVAETAVETGPAEVRCVDSLVKGIRSRSDVLGFVWFEFNKAGVDWTLADRPAISTALQQEIRHLKIVDVRQP
jgi:mannan endo-1,4-beta-mannosidase